MYERDAVKAAHQVFGRERGRKRERVCDITDRKDLETQKEGKGRCSQRILRGREREKRESVYVCVCMCDMAHPRDLETLREKDIIQAAHEVFGRAACESPVREGWDLFCEIRVVGPDRQRWVVWAMSLVVQCSVVWCGVVQCGAVWCSVVQCGAVWCSVVQCGRVWCSVV